MTLPTQAQIDAAKRYAIAVASSATSITFIAAFLAHYGIDTKGIIDLINQLGAVAVAAVSLVGVLLTVWSSVRGFFAASPDRQVASLKQTMASASTSTETKQAVLAGAVDTVAVAADRAEPKVQDAAKVALLDAAAKLPEVVGTIKVSSAALAADTKSDQVVKAV